MSTDLDDHPYRRVHRLTPLLRFWVVILTALAALLLNIGIDTMSTIWSFFADGSLWQIPAGIGAFAALCGLVWLVSQIWWAATGYRLTDEEISLRRGVLSRQLRTARHDRIQAVDVVEKLIPRLFRLAAVRVETAGGGNSVIEISYLRRDVAEQVRAELLAKVHGPTPGPPGDGPGEEPRQAPQADSQQGEPVPQIPIARSLAGAALRSTAVLGLPVLLTLILLQVPLAVLLPVLVGVGPTIWRQIDRSWRFTASLDGEEERAVLNLSYGLANRRRQAIPLRRIHGVSIHQPALWRAPDWWMVTVSVAGYGDDSASAATTAILPVGSREQAVQLLALVSPLDHSRIEHIACPEGATVPDFRSPLTARPVSPVDHRQQAVTLREDAVVVHTGRLARRVAVIDPAHIQELTLSRGPVQRLLGLCTVRFDLVKGPVAMAGEDLTYEQGRALLDALRRRRLPALEQAR